MAQVLLLIAMQANLQLTTLTTVIVVWLPIPDGAENARSITLFWDSVAQQLETPPFRVQANFVQFPLVYAYAVWGLAFAVRSSHVLKQAPCVVDPSRHFCLAIFAWFGPT